MPLLNISGGRGLGLYRVAVNKGGTLVDVGVLGSTLRPPAVRVETHASVSSYST